MKKTSWKWTGALALAMACLSGKANAFTTTANLDIDVTIGGSKSVTVNGTGAPTASTSTVSSFATLGPNGMIVSLGTATVQNNSGILSEGFELSTPATSLDNGGSLNQTWTLGTSTAPMPGAETFAVQAVFGSSSTVALGCPATSSPDWNNGTSAPLLTATPVRYTSTVFADASLAAGGANTYKPDDGTNTMYANNATTGTGNRALCYRVVLPLSTANSDAQLIQVIVTAL